MSAGADPLPAGTPAVDHDLGHLAPQFRLAVIAAVAACRAAGYDVVVFETGRSHALATLYYKRGRTIKPPRSPVTNAPDETYTWHGYCLAVDVISEAHGWDKPEGWFAAVAEIFKKHGCKWGGDWTHPDLPHMQWGHCRPSPSARAREILAASGKEAVWAAVLAA